MIDRAVIPTNNGYGWRSTVPNQVTAALLEWLAYLSEPRPRVIDVGTGFGVGTLSLLEHGARVIALDLDESHLSFIERSATRQGFRNRLTTIVGHFPGSLHFEGLDVVHCSNVLHFLSGSEIELGAERIFQWLKPGGKVFIQIGTVYAGHVKRFLPVFRDARRAGMKWPGETERARDYIAAEFRDAMPNFMNFLDDQPLVRTFESCGFKIEKSWYYTRTGLPEMLLNDGRENFGLIARRDT